MYLLVEDTGNIHAQCLDIMPVKKRSYKLWGSKVDDRWDGNSAGDSDSGTGTGIGTLDV